MDDAILEHLKSGYQSDLFDPIIWSFLKNHIYAYEYLWRCFKTSKKVNPMNIHNR